MVKKTILIIVVITFASFVVYYFFPERRLPNAFTVTKLVVLKSKRQLLVYSKSKLINTYKISLGFCPVGKKQFENDGKTPEGKYYINDKKSQ